MLTGPLAAHLDQHQYGAGLGPCLDAAASGQTIVVDTRQGDSPYREFAKVAERAGVRHVASVGMPLAQRTIGGLNVYRSADSPFTSAFLKQAQLIADHAAVEVANITSYANASSKAPGLQ